MIFPTITRRFSPKIATAAAAATVSISTLWLQQQNTKKEKEQKNHHEWFRTPTTCRCEEVAVEEEPKKSTKKEEEEFFHGMFPKRQLHQPKVEYPLWDSNWDGRQMESTGDRTMDYQRERELRKKGVTRHIILVRHGQYDETNKEDEKRILTPLGRKQAELTGKRLGDMIMGYRNKKDGTGDFDSPLDPCCITKIHVSNLARAKETADIIARQLQPFSANNTTIERTEPNECLNEMKPCHNIPPMNRKVSPSSIQAVDENQVTIEKAFHTYFHRADTDTTNETKHKHEFEIIVCHGNVIRYLFCRALQLPPEAWLRLTTFNCSLTYFCIKPTGSVSCRMMGDIGHLDYENSTFSMHHGFNW